MAQPAYAARFRLTKPVLWLLFGVLFAALYGWVVVVVVTGGLPSYSAFGQWLGLLLWGGVGYLILRTGVRRLARVWRSDHVAFAVDADGVHLGAAPGGRPSFTPWSQVAAIVLSKEVRVSTNEHGKSTTRVRRYVGVVPRPGSPGGIEEFRERLERFLARDDLTARERRKAERFHAGVRPDDVRDRYRAGTCLRELDWRLDEKQLKDTVKRLGGETPVVRRAGSHEWLAYRTGLDRMLANR